MVTKEMKDLLKRLEDLCYQVSEEVFENEETKEILDTCDKLELLINGYLGI